MPRKVAEPANHARVRVFLPACGNRVCNPQTRRRYVGWAGVTVIDQYRTNIIQAFVQINNRGSGSSAKVRSRRCSVCARSASCR